MDTLRLPMLLHTKFCSIFIIVTLIEAHRERQGNQGFLARPTISRTVAGSQLDTQTTGKHTGGPKNKTRGGTPTKRQKVLSEALWTLLCSLFFFWSLFSFLPKILSDFRHGKFSGPTPFYFV